MTTLVALSAGMFTFPAIFHYLLVIKVVFRGKKRHMKIFEDVWSLLEISVPIKFPPTFCTFQFSSHILVLSCCSVVCELYRKYSIPLLVISSVSSVPLLTMWREATVVI